MYDTHTFLVNFTAGLAEYIYRAPDSDEKALAAAHSLLEAVSNMLPTGDEAYPAPAQDTRLN